MIAVDRVAGWRCAVCATEVGIDAPHPFTCPAVTALDRHHVLHPVIAPARRDDDGDDGSERNTLVRYRRRMAWWAFGIANGMSDTALVDLARHVAADVVVTPVRSFDLALGGAGAPAPVWIKDETCNAGGSHKSRHLVGILLHLLAAEHTGVAPRTGGRERPPLAIASCGNAAVAAATLASRADWQLQVFVPDWAGAHVLDLIAGLGGDIVVCPRRADDPPGDPALLRFREAVAAGAIPFTVQGPENALCLDAGRTIGWELADAVSSATGPATLDRVAVQVGGGAFAACVGWGLGSGVRLDTVQAQGCAPLARAWWRAHDLGIDARSIAGRWSQLMQPWERPSSAADGILDDETYDWLADVAVMAASGGRPIVVPEEAIHAAHRLAATTGVPTSVTGSAGLAGLLVPDGRPVAGETVAVIFSGIERTGAVA